MSIAWWGRARERGPGGPAVGTIATFVLALLVASFATGTWALVFPPEPLVGPSTHAELQALLDGYRRDLADRNQTAFELNLDPARPALVKCARERFPFAEEWAAELAPLRLLEVEEWGKDYASGLVLERQGTVRYYFRRAGVFWVRSKAPFNIIGTSFRWYVSEPRATEVGEERRRTVDDLEVTYWSVDEDVAEAVGRAAAAARDFALAQAPARPRAPFIVRVYPTRELASTAASCLSLANYEPNARAPEVRVHRVSRDSSGDVTSHLRAVLRHEALRWVQDQTIEGISRVADWWLIEGWAEVLAELDRARALRGEECRAYPTLNELARRPRFTDAHDLRLIVYASAAVRYLLERYGSEGYWRLLAAFAERRDREAAYRSALGVGTAAFHAAWVEWARAKYCPSG